jgi:hypothetical protein
MRPLITASLRSQGLPCQARMSSHAGMSYLCEPFYAAAAPVILPASLSYTPLSLFDLTHLPLQTGALRVVAPPLNRLIIAHGILMSLAFALLLPTGILLMRYRWVGGSGGITCPVLLLAC